MSAEHTEPIRNGSPESETARYYSGIDWGALVMHLLGKIHWIILAALVGGVAAWIYVTRMVTPVYQATSKIYIAGSDTTISLSDLQLGSTLATDYQEVFKIWHVHEMVDERLNLDYSYSKLAEMVSVNNPSGSHLLYINVSSSDPEEAKLLADTYAEVVQDYIANKMELRKPQILEKARTPYSPVYPNVRSTVIRGALAGGMGLTVLLMFIFLIDDRIRTGDDVQKAVGIPVFGTVTRQHMDRNAAEKEAPNEKTADPKGPNSRMPFASIEGNLTLDYSGEEAVNTVCSGMTFAGAGVKRVLISSCHENEGKSFLALQTAIGMTRRGKRVLLIDADLRLSVLQQVYRIRYTDGAPGLAHLLSGQRTLGEVVHETNIPGLYLLPDGASVKTPLMLLTSPAFRQAMEELAKSFDMIIVDTPPLGQVVDAAEIARCCDGSLLVLETNHVHAKELKRSVALLRQTGTPVLGCVLNKAPVSRIGKYGYGYRYGYGYGYGYGERKEKSGGGWKGTWSRLFGKRGE